MPALSPSKCAELGFISEELLCATCDKVLSTIGDQALFDECRSCCHQPVVTHAPKATLEVCSRYLRSLPEVKGFVDQHASGYKNLSVRFAAGSPPELVLRDKEGHVIERVGIAEWTIAQMHEYLQEKLEL